MIAKEKGGKSCLPLVVGYSTDPQMFLIKETMLV